jgi:hypothetical protein
MADLRFFLSTSHLCNVPPLKKGDEGGFEFDFSCCHRLDFLNELLRHHTSVMKLKFAKEVRVSRPSCSRKRASRSLWNFWIPGRASYRQLARNDAQ